MNKTIKEVNPMIWEKTVTARINVMLHRSKPFNEPTPITKDKVETAIADRLNHMDIILDDDLTIIESVIPALEQCKENLSFIITVENGQLPRNELNKLCEWLISGRNYRLHLEIPEDSKLNITIIGNGAKREAERADVTIKYSGPRTTRNGTL